MNSIVHVGDGDRLYGEQWNLSGDRRVSIVLRDWNVLSKRQVWMSIFHIINLSKKKIMDTGVLNFFNKKLILDYYSCLKSGPVFLFQIMAILQTQYISFAL
jgi:hypothetical protein